MYKLAKAPHPKTYEGLTANTWELYDLEKDPTETTNIAKNNHEIVSQLSQAYFKWAATNGVVDFAELEAVEPESMKAFRKSKEQEVPAPAFGL